MSDLYERVPDEERPFHPVMLFLVRLFFRLMTRALYRVTVIGGEHIPREGAGLLVANHTSLTDALVISSAARRYVRFLILEEYYQSPLVRLFARTFKAIPINPGGRPADLIRSLDIAADDLKRGKVVCVFAEGQITRTGNMLGFSRGFERIARRAGAPVIPVHIDSMWGSLLSFERDGGGRLVWKRPRQMPYPVTLSFGAPLPADATVFAVRQKIMEMGTAAFENRELVRTVLPVSFIHTAYVRWFHKAMADSTGAELSFGRALTASALLARRIERMTAQTHVGVLLPASVGGALTNLAISLAGKIPVNLNFTAGAESIRSAARQCGIDTVITSKRFLEKVEVEVPGNAVYLEDLKAAIPAWRGALAWAGYFLMPRGALTRAVYRGGLDARATATVIFSSGSTGEPKGIELSHANIAHNIAAAAQIFDVRPSDVMLGALPFFHSFGYMGTFWFPLIAGYSAAYHPNPLDVAAIGKLAGRQGVTILVATPTFCAAYTRKITPEQFSRLRYALVGAEKLQPNIAEAFQKTFGVALMEGYGATECAPLVSVNIPDARAPEGVQVGRKPGTIGHPVPGVTVRIANPETLEPRGPGEEGMILVKGPNVMKGYLNDPRRTADAIRDGWYVTGDIGRMDEDGFLTITGRAARFSKIGGEMVPHGRVEEILNSYAGGDDQVIAVTAVEDAQKGERLAVLHTVDLDPEALTRRMRQDGWPNLWIPRRDMFTRIAALPLLGTGKLDLAKIKQIAGSRS